MFKRFYSVDTKPGVPDPEIEISMRSKILEVLTEHPGASQSEISYLLDETIQKVTYHVSKLREEGLVRMDRDVENNRILFLEEKH